MMKKITLLILLIASLMNIAWAQEAAPVDEPQPEVSFALDDVSPFMDNLGNRFVYAFFGRDTLVFLLDDPNHKQIARDIDENVLNAAAAPFNFKLSGFYVFALFTLLSYYYMGYFALKLVFKIFELAWMGQKEGGLPLRPGEFRQLIMRLVIVGGLVFVSTGSINAFQAGVLGLFYQTSTLTDKASANLVRNKDEIAPVVALPFSHAKQEEMLDVLSYATCVASTGGSLPQQMTLYESETGGGGSISSGDCHLSIEFTIDKKFDERLVKLFSSQEETTESDLYQKAQKQVLHTLITEIMSDANHYATVLTLPGSDRVFDKRNPEIMAGWGRNRHTNGVEAWEDSCDAFRTLDLGVSEIAPFDRQVYAFHASRCMSYEINKALLYPAQTGDVEAFLDTGVLKHRQLMLCEDDLASFDVVPNIINGFNSQERVENQRTQVSIEACALKHCSESALTNGSLYMCANAVMRLQKQERDERVIAQGNMIMGAYIFELFTSPIEYTAGRKTFNGLTFKYSNSLVPPKLDIDSESPLFIVPVQRFINAGNEIDYRQGTVESAMLFDDVSVFMKGPAPSLNIFMTSISPFERLSTCVQTPLSAAGGYMCGNVPQEMNRMGRDLIHYAVSAKAVMIGAAVINDSRTLLADKAGGAAVGGLGASTKMLGLASTLGINEAIMTTLSDLFGTPLNDPFDNRLDKESVWRTLLSDKFGMMLIAALSTNGLASHILDLAIGLMLIMGLFLGVILPMLPVMLFIIALAMAFYLLFKVIIIGPIQLIDIAFEDDASILTEKAESLMGDVVAMALKIPLTFIGLVVAWLMSNSVISAIMQELTLSETMNIAAGSSTTGIIDAIILSIVSLIVLYFFFATVISVIEGLYDFVVKFALGEQGSDPFSSQKGALTWSETRQSFKNMVAMKV